MQMRRLLFACVLMWSGLCALVDRVFAQHPTTTQVNLTWSTDAVEQRFIAVHGRRALVMGYPRPGLEMWAYPLQLVSNYEVSFISMPGTHSVDGLSLLRRIEYRPDEVVRTYVGPDFVVREK